MDLGTVAAVALAAIALIGLVTAGIAWFYKRGGQERESTIAMRQNTTATTELTKRMDAFMVKSEAVQETQGKIIANHETRISVTEVNVNALQRMANGHDAT